MTHIMEALGKAKVYIENGKIIKIEEPKLKYCPLFNKKKNIKIIDKESIKNNIEERIKNIGLFTKNRVLDEKEDVIHFGVSEILSTSLKNNLIDTTVTVCDGAGTVITSNPVLVQSIGGHLSGLIQTEPILEIIEKIENKNGFVIDKKCASINQLQGVKNAIKYGYQRIAVTVSSIKDVIEIRSFEKEHHYEFQKRNITIILLAVHTSEMSKQDAMILSQNVDIATACASKNIRELKPLFQVGVSIPLFAFSNIGKLLLIERIKDVKIPIVSFSQELPFLKKEQPYYLF